MIDYSKRESMKNVLRVGAGVAVGAISSQAGATLLNDAHKNAADAATLDLAEIEFSTRVSPLRNDLEVVITNKGNAAARITDMTPSQISTARGTFDFDALFENGDVHLAVGESVRVPLQHKAAHVLAGSNRARSIQLSTALRQNVSVITDGNSLAAVKIVDNAQYIG